MQTVEIRGASFRFIAGNITAYLTISGTISRGDETLFAFQDRISLTSPVNPGPPPPREAELLLHLAVRTFAIHLLNELLLKLLNAGSPGYPADADEIGGRGRPPHHLLYRLPAEGR